MDRWSGPRGGDGRRGETLAVGLAGLGRIASYFHLPILGRHPLVRLVGVAEPDSERLEGVDLGPGVARRKSLDELLESEDLDAVVVCLPSGQHSAAARAALDAGVHLYVEKPLALEGSDASELADAWSGSGLVGAVGFNSRVNPAFADLGHRLGEVGEIVAVRGSVGSARRELPGWKREVASGGGALFDLASHHLDLVPALVGSAVEAVAARTSSLHAEEHSVALTLTLADFPAPVQLLASITAVQEDRLEVYGDRGLLVADRYLDRRARFRPAEVGDARRSRLRGAAREATAQLERAGRIAAPAMEPSFQLALDAFVNACLGRGRPVATIDDGARCAAVVDAARRSVREDGAPVGVSRPTDADASADR